MTKTLFAMSLTLLLALTVGCKSTSSCDACSTCSETQCADWEVLFDGSTTEHFRGYRKAGFPEKGWAVEGDSLRKIARAGGGDIITKKQYSDFDLRFEWKVAKAANSGIMYRVAEADDIPATYFTGPEYQILDDDNHPDGKNIRNRSADLYALIKCNEKKELKPVGEWNTARIVIKDNNVKHYLNGELVVEYTWASDEIKALIADSKFGKWKRFMTMDKGHIAFQDHGDDVWFRNIKIQDLAAE